MPNPSSFRALSLSARHYADSFCALERAALPFIQRLHPEARLEDVDDLASILRLTAIVPYPRPHYVVLDVVPDGSATVVGKPTNTEHYE